MSTLTIQLDDEKLELVRQAAAAVGKRPEELVLDSIDQYLAARRELFEQASAYVRSKNAELYRRLAK